ncbi:hypothetical protein K461DRAFT_36848 [Myriangium duriaei CBS 260.36]|uniref:Uncharacterized protein n=1 Tax=Myriangium duriaei CBS 260.36 TaxID=1168546 RepID=A0A9P4IY25_9PEZI|nr:hypothetical protein K461DRAFT_36848 [Myriangium duriaei CBS 260.36]
MAHIALPFHYQRRTFVHHSNRALHETPRSLAIACNDNLPPSKDTWAKLPRHVLLHAIFIFSQMSLDINRQVLHMKLVCLSYTRDRYLEFGWGLLSDGTKVSRACRHPSSFLPATTVYFWHEILISGRVGASLKSTTEIGPPSRNASTAPSCSLPNDKLGSLRSLDASTP